MPGKFFLALCMTLATMPWLPSQMVWGQISAVMDPEQMTIAMDSLQGKDLGQALSGLTQKGKHTMEIMYETGDLMDPEQADSLGVQTSRESSLFLHWPIDPEQAQELVKE